MDLHVLVPGDLALRTGGYGYARRAIAGLRTLGLRVSVHTLSAVFPRPDPAALRQADAVLRGIADRSVVLVDGLAYGAMPGVVQRHADRLRLVALVHHPLAMEGGLQEDEARRLRAGEADALRVAARVITTSRATASLLRDYGVAPSRVDVAVPGTDPAPLARGSQADPASGLHPATVMLCVATLTPRKGHAVLLDALARQPAAGWRLRCVGSATRDPATAAAVRARIGALGLCERVTLCGEVDDAALARHYDEADLFVLASSMEGYGMALAEALARGLPVIATTAGAIPDTVPAGAGILVAPGDAGALAGALARFLDEPALRRSLREGATRARQDLPDWPEACRALHRILQRVADR